MPIGLPAIWRMTDSAIAIRKEDQKEHQKVPKSPPASQGRLLLTHMKDFLAYLS